MGNSYITLLEKCEPELTVGFARGACKFRPNSTSIYVKLFQALGGF
jgi:hypothetical protein